MFLVTVTVPTTEAGERQKVMKVFCENPGSLITPTPSPGIVQTRSSWVNMKCSEYTTEQIIRKMIM